MASKFFEQIRKYYLQGYGYPRRFYCDEDIDAFVAAGRITTKEAAALKAEKKHPMAK